MKDYLMTISIGPVQDFIAAARRLRDLWFGSYLLSELAKQAVRSLHSRNAELIFPAFGSPGDLVAGSEMKAPNKLLARISCDDPRRLFSEIREEIDRFWRTELAEKTILNARKNVDKTLFDRQIGDFLEIYAAWAPVNGNGYSLSRQRADSLLASRKSLRDFSQLEPLVTDQGGGLPKSSLDGVRESVLKGENRKKGIKENEELDALGWIKRYGEKLGDAEKLPEFDSLSDLAADPFLRGAVKDAKAFQALEELTAHLKTQNLDIPRVKTEREYRFPLHSLPPQVLFESRVGRDYDVEKLDKHQEKEIRKRLKRIYRAAGHSQGPLPYTAILVGDGDHMGITIDGIDDEDAHRAFSTSLDDFARSCDRIVKDHHGCLIYSGGDDVMAFVPLDTVLNCADRLRSSFAERMKTALKDQKKQPTFSIGIAIVHHLRPMGISLQLARQAERLAKDGGRNALAVILDKRSGAPLKIVDQWSNGFVERLSSWVRYHRQDLIPDKLGYELRRLSKEFGNDTLQWKDGKPDSPLAFEFLRVLERKRADQGRKKVKPAEIDAIAKTAAKLGELDRLSNELVLSRIFADAKTQAREEMS